MRSVRCCFLILPLLVFGMGSVLHAQLYFPDHFWYGIPGNDFVSLPEVPEGSPIGNIFQEWGIRVRSEPHVREEPHPSNSLDTPESFVVLRRIACVPPPLIPEPIPCSPYDFFSNDVGHPVDPAHRNRPLALLFERPVQRVQFVLANGSEELHVVFRGYDSMGRELGQLDYSYSNRSEEQPFTDPILVGTSSTDGISMLVVDYGDSDRAEQLGQLRVAFHGAPVYDIYIPQIAAGRLPSGWTLSTAITVMGLSDTTSWGWMSFFEPSGSYLPVDFEQCNDEELLECHWWGEIGFGNRPVRMVLEPNPDGLKTGSVHISSVGGPTAVSASYTISDGNRIVTQAGIAAVKPGWRISGYVRYHPPTVSGTVGPGLDQPEINTGIAIVNASGDDVTVHITLEPSSGWATPGEIEIPVQGRTSQFVTELFPDFDPAGFEGRVKITADGPVAATFLETQDGVVLSSLPGEALPEAIGFH